MEEWTCFLGETGYELIQHFGKHRQDRGWRGICNNLYLSIEYINDLIPRSVVVRANDQKSQTEPLKTVSIHHLDTLRIP